MAAYTRDPPENVTVFADLPEAEWLAKHDEDLTASVIAAPFGLHPYKSGTQVWAEHAGLIAPKHDSSKLMRRGKALEPVIIGEMQAKHPEWLIRAATEYFRDTVRRLGATPDAYIIDTQTGELGVMQIKVVGSGVFKSKWTVTDETTGEIRHEPPFWIVLQVMLEMMLTGAAFGVIAVLVIGDHEWAIYEFTVPRHPATEARIYEVAEQFWQSIKDGVPPAFDYTRDGPIIKALFPRHVAGKVIDGRGDNRLGALLDELAAAQAAKKAAEETVETLKNELRAKVGDAEELLAPDGRRVTNRLKHIPEKTVPAYSYRDLRIRHDKND